MIDYTVFTVFKENPDRRYTMHVIANSPEDAEKKAHQTAPMPIVISAVIRGHVTPVDRLCKEPTPINKKGYETQAAEVSVRYRKVNIPSQCPKCKTNLCEYESTRQWDYWSFYWDGRVPRGCHNGDIGIAVNHEKGARSLTTRNPVNITCVVISCNKCNHLLWNGVKET